MTIKPIPTEYAGVRFRSRLEAGYAATFTSLSLAWQYEPEGYQLSDGTWYEPDFYLPSAKAWLEVKGDHMQRVSKVEQFAAELWKKADEPEIDSPIAPMVLLATSPRNFGAEVGHGLERGDIWRPNFLGVRGIGKRYSVAMARCSACNQKTFIALWQNTCRACGMRFEDGLDAWHDSHYKIWYETEFVRVGR